MCRGRRGRRGAELRGRWAGLLWLAALAACEGGPGPAPSASTRGRRAEHDEEVAVMRERMVEQQIEPRGVKDERVLEAMRKVPRERFVPEHLRRRAYGDHPLPIGYDVTISQPYIVALMTELAAISPGDRVLEVGTGSGYQTAVLAELGAQVYSIEIIEPLATSSAALLSELGYDDVHVRHGDGYAGWPEHAPYQAIIVTAAPPRIPRPLEEQLAQGGRLVVPVGARFDQELLVVTRTQAGFRQNSVIPVAFVPMVGEAQK